MKIRATVHYTQNADCEVEIRTQDGGVANIYNNGEHFITEYYQDRDFNDEVDYDKLAEGKGYMKGWDEDKEVVDKEMIDDALNWLVMSTESFEWDIREYVNTPVPNITTQDCTKCFETKPLKDFYTDKRRANGHCSECKDCHNALVRGSRVGKCLNLKDK